MFSLKVRGVLWNSKEVIWYSAAPAKPVYQLSIFLLSRTHLKRFVSSAPAGGSVVIRRTSSCMQLSWQRNRRSLQLNHHQENICIKKTSQCRHLGFRATKTQSKNRPPVLGLALLQHILLVHKLCECDILLVQQGLQMRRCVQVKLPKHGCLSLEPTLQLMS